jgi:hypothetical protein
MHEWKHTAHCTVYKTVIHFRRGKYTFLTMAKTKFERVHIFDTMNLNASPVEIRSKLNRINTAVIKC